MKFYKYVIDVPDRHAPTELKMIKGSFDIDELDKLLTRDITKKPNAAATCEPVESDVKAKALRARMLWSEMLKRTFKIDVTVCPHCGGRLEQIAVIKDKVVAKAILKSLQETTIFRPLTVIWERGPPVQPNGFENEFGYFSLQELIDCGVKVVTNPEELHEIAPPIGSDWLNISR